MKAVWSILMMSLIAVAGEVVEITSMNFEANEKKLISVFSGNVFVKKGKDTIKAQKLIVKFDSDKKPQKYEAVGNVKFKIMMDQNKTYEGKAGKIIYFPKKAKYIFQKDVYVVQLPEMRKIYGEKIIVDKSSGQAIVTGKKNKPVKFIFKIEENATKGKK